jgi:hypothetical protein
MKNPIIEEIEVLEKSVEVAFYYEGDTDATIVNISHEDLLKFIVENGFMELQYEEHCPVTLYSREWVQYIGYDDIINNVEQREYLTIIVKYYLPRILKSLQQTAA